MSTFTPTNTATSNTPSNKRRSARVQKRDPIVAPGFGTAKDVENWPLLLDCQPKLYT